MPATSGTKSLYQQQLAQKDVYGSMKPVPTKRLLTVLSPHLVIVKNTPLCQHSTHKKGFESFASRFVVRLLHATSVPNRAKTLFQKLQAKRALQKPYSRTEMIERKINSSVSFEWVRAILDFKGWYLKTEILLN